VRRATRYRGRSEGVLKGAVLAWRWASGCRLVCAGVGGGGGKTFDPECGEILPPIDDEKFSPKTKKNVSPLVGVFLSLARPPLGRGAGGGVVTNRDNL
jgi:hypothetical protein